jgi:hypothetical protein
MVNSIIHSCSCLILSQEIPPKNLGGKAREERRPSRRSAFYTPLFEMDDSTTRGRKKMMPRLEGLVIQKRAAIEQPRYLVMDLSNGSISLYKKPPGLTDVSSPGKRFGRSKLASSLKGSLQRSSSEPSKQGTDVESMQLSCEYLAHLSTEERDYLGSPIFTVPFTENWKIRDIENDEFMFYLVLPSDFKTKDPNVEILAMSKIGNSVSYRNLNASFDLDSVDEDSTPDTKPTRRRESITYQQSSFKRSMFAKSFARDKPLKQEKIL